MNVFEHERVPTPVCTPTHVYPLPGTGGLSGCCSGSEGGVNTSRGGKSSLHGAVGVSGADVARMRGMLGGMA